MNGLNFEGQDKRDGVHWAQILELCTALIGLVLYLLGIGNQYPLLSKVLLILIVVAFAALIGRYAWKFLQWAMIRLRENALARSEQKHLCDFFVQFERFASRSEGLPNTVAPLSNPAVYRFLSMYWLDAWINSFQAQLGRSSRSLQEFLDRQNEFKSLVTTFNRNYVLVLQRELHAEVPIPQININQLEVFREEFTAFLRDLEKWNQSVFIAVHELNEGSTADPKRFPVQWFDRVPSFSRAGTVLVDGKPVG